MTGNRIHRAPSRPVGVDFASRGSLSRQAGLTAVDEQSRSRFDDDPMRLAALQCTAIRDDGRDWSLCADMMTGRHRACGLFGPTRRRRTLEL